VCVIPENQCPTGQEHYHHSSTSSSANFTFSTVVVENFGYCQSESTIASDSYVLERFYTYSHDDPTRKVYDYEERVIMCRPTDPDPTNPDTGGGSSEIPNNELEMSNEDFNLASAIAGILSSTLLVFAILVSF
jgi:hypothetical protein